MPNIIITEPGHEALAYSIGPEHIRVKIGRGSDNDIQLKCESVSENHAELILTESGYSLSDLASVNGISIDGEKISHIALQNNSVAKIGEVEFGFTMSEEELAQVTDDAASIEDEKTLVEEIPQKEKKAEPKSLKSAPSSLSPRYTYTPEVEKSTSFVGMLFFLLLTISFAFGGFAYRHYQETEEFVYDALKEKFAPSQEAPTAEEAQDTAVKPLKEKAPAKPTQKTQQPAEKAAPAAEPSMMGM